MNTVEFHKTTTKELLAIKDRVRHLIKHWGVDGIYQEAVLKSVIERFLPERFCIASGFVIKQVGIPGQHEASKQIDIIIYDRDYPVLFKEGDFAIVTADSVEAIIEVKANLKNQGPEKVIRKSNEIGQFIFNAKSNKGRNLYNGVFPYSGHEKLNISNSKNLQAAIKNAASSTQGDPNLNKFKVNHTSFNKNLFYKFWNQNDPTDGDYLYEIKDLSFSYFISSLMANLKQDSVIFNNKLWFPPANINQVKF